MIKLYKNLSRKNIRILLLTIGLGTFFVSVTVLLINFMRTNIFMLSILVLLVFPGISTFFDGMTNKFILKKVELYKIFGGLVLGIYIFTLIYLRISSILTNVSFIIYLVNFELLMIGLIKLILGIKNTEYVNWYRKWLISVGFMILIFSVANFFPIPFKEEFFLITVFITVAFDGFSNILYGIKKNIEIENSDKFRKDI